MLILNNIHKQYVAGDSSVAALNGVSVKFRDSEFVSILGPSGCGKTTLLNIIGGLDHYSEGDLIINGKSTKAFKDSDWDTYRNHRIGFVFQSYNLIPHQSVLSNVELALTLSGVSKQERRRRAKKVLERVGLADQIHKKPSQMSGGQMQRVAIARALVNDPDILLADEPTGALDSQTSVQIMEILKEISKDKLIIMVTHNPELAEQYSSRIVRILDGKLVSDSDPFDGRAAVVSTSNPEEKEAKKPSMSFFTAMSLSLNNLLTKKGRTTLVSFAGSIGIIGIALILALSNGIQAYIDSVQQETLSSYPISIQAESTDMTSLMTSMMGLQPEGSEPHGKDAVYANPIMFRMMKTIMTAETKKNNLEKFKVYLDSNMDELNDYITAIKYGYDIDLNIYATDSKGNYSKSDFMDLMNEMMGGSGFSSAYTSYFSSMGTMTVWEELTTDKNGKKISPMITDQYDVVYGDWPTKENEIVLVLTSNNEISDITLFSLGLTPREDLINSMMAALSGKADTLEDITGKSWSYEEICNIPLKMILPTDYYQYDEKSGLWMDISENSVLLNSVISHGLDLNISGIIRPKEGATSLPLTGSLCYTPRLTEYYIDAVNNSDIIKMQTSDEYANMNVITGLPFVLDEDDAIEDSKKSAAFLEYVSTLNEEEKAKLYQSIMCTPTDEYIDEQVQVFVKEYEDHTAEEIVTIIADNFASQLGYSKELIKQMLSDYEKDELIAMITETAKEMLRTQYEEKALAGIEKIVMTPSADELAMLKAQITATVYKDISSLTGDTYKMAKRMVDTAIITQAWKTSTQMSESAISAYLAGLSNEDIDALADGIFTDMAAEQYQNYASYITDEVRAQKLAIALDQHLVSLSEETLIYYFDTHMPSQKSELSYDDLLKELGVCSLDSPSYINIYPKDFEMKENIADMITRYNDKAAKDDKISYTDIVAMLMSSVSTIINAISIVLIGFVSISLVVSSIMIGIITYISVLERTKEIGILRAIGASKKDISRVFNAETFIVGLAAGIIGIVITLLLCIPINIIVHALTEIPALNAFLPWYGYLLILVSVTLTMIAGLLPSMLAARKDPVIALRSE